MIREAFLHFWQRAPALLLGLALLLGIAASLSTPLLFAAIFLLLAVSAQKKSMILITTCLFALGYLSTPLRCPITTLPSEKIEGIGLFVIDSLQIQASPFSQSLVYRGTLKEFTAADGTMYRDLPCALFHPKSKKFPPADSNYRIAGSLLQKGERQFVLKPQPHRAWEPIADTHSFAQWRHLAKQSLATHLKKKITHPDARELLTALATGEVHNRILKMQFAKIGLQHILAISGFHFALVALFLYGILRILLPRTPGYLLLIVALSLYYFYLGNAPSIQRAYIALTLFFIGKIAQWRITGLNALGCALCLELLIDPLSICDLGFQLSFLCTLAILLFYTPMHAAIKHLLPE
ncbi:MAG: ComEC/Rec2 family competence protein, partial [Chlamydiota bacterium]